MATALETKATRALEPEQRVLLRGVGWDGYEAILILRGGEHVRIACDGEDVELMATSRDHETLKTRIARLIEMLTAELDIPCDGYGSTTWRKAARKKGLEPDECYYLANAARVMGREIDLTVDPPPDLALEVEISRSAMDRLGIYAALGVPEVWRFDGDSLVIEHLQADGTYARVPVSPGLPIFTPEEVVRWVHKAEGVSQTQWIREFREWVRAELAPRHP